MLKMIDYFTKLFPVARIQQAELSLLRAENSQCKDLAIAQRNEIAALKTKVEELENSIKNKDEELKSIRNSKKSLPNNGTFVVKTDFDVFKS